jgi:hypothetical protein
LTRPAPRRLASTLAATGALLALGPVAAAQAHGLVQRSDLPIPEWLFGWGAAVVLVVSFVALAVLWQQPRYERRGMPAGTPTTWKPLPGGLGRLGAPPVDTICQVLGAFLFGVVLWAGLVGTDTPQANLTPTFVFVVFWVGLVFLSVLLGDVFHAFNPWRALGRATGATVARLRGGRAWTTRPYPERLGRWPAAVGLFGFTWLELAEGGGEHPRTLATATIVYSVVTFAGMAVYGVRPWLRHGEAFSVYFGLFARIAPLEVRDGRLGTRRPLEGLTRLDVGPGLIGVVAVMIGTVTYDGLSSGKLWKDVQKALDGLWEPLGMSVTTGLKASATVGMLACILLVAGFYRLGVLGMRSVGGGFDAQRLSRGFVHSLVPIAMVYVAAHYLTLLAFQGQATLYLASDPLGHGWDLFGTATSSIDYFLGQNLTWYLQVGFVVFGHMAGLALAHDRALVLYGDARRAARSQYWMLSVMVGFTTLALWLLAQAGA